MWTYTRPMTILLAPHLSACRRVLAWVHNRLARLDGLKRNHPAAMTAQSKQRPVPSRVRDGYPRASLIERTIRYCVLLCACQLLAAVSLADGASPPCQSTVTGDLRLHTLSSQIFGNTRTIRVLVPPGYDAPENAARKYPVLYLLDGQNLFDACLSLISHHEWEVDETVDRLIREHKIPPLIVVGIDHAGKDRAIEYLPYKDYLENPTMPDPIGKKFPDFLTDEVMPLIDGQYRTLRGHDNTGIGGSSYGGVAALYALLAKPRVFGFGLIESASLSVGMGQLVRDTAPLVARPKRVFIGFGGKEDDEPLINDLMISLVRQVQANFAAAGYDETRLRVVIDPEAHHTEAAWAKRLPDALTFLYGSPAARQ
jgi:predicted alpha/beta superfamily hydrolase